MAGVLIKQSIKRHWSPGCSSFEEPELNQQDKQQFVDSFPLLLRLPEADLSRLGCAAFSVAVSCDHTLMTPALAVVVTAVESGDAVAVRGGVEALVLFARDIPETEAARLLVHVHPHLLRTYDSTPTTRVQVLDAIRALYCFATVVPNSPEAAAMQGPICEWSKRISVALSAVDVEVQHYAVRAAQSLLNNASLLGDTLSPLLASLWGMLSGVISCDEADASSQKADRWGNVISRRSNAIWALESTTELVSRPCAAGHLQNNLRPLLELSLRFICMDAEGVADLLADPEQCVFEEMEGSLPDSPRAAARALFTELVSGFESALGEASVLIPALCVEAADKKAADDLEEIEGDEGDEDTDLAQDGPVAFFRQLISQVVIPLLQPSAPTFLASRALILAGHCAPFLPESLCSQFFGVASGTLLRKDLDELLRISGLFAVQSLAAKVSTSTLNANAASSFSSLLSLLSEHPSEDVLHLVLDTVAVLAAKAPGQARGCLAELLEAVCTTWKTTINDPFAAMSVSEIVGNFSLCAECVPALRCVFFDGVVGDLVHLASKNPYLQTSSLSIMRSACLHAPLSTSRVGRLGPVVALLSDDDDETGEAAALLLQTVLCHTVSPPPPAEFVVAVYTKTLALLPLADMALRSSTVSIGLLRHTATLGADRAVCLAGGLVSLLSSVERVTVCERIATALSQACFAQNPIPLASLIGSLPSAALTASLSRWCSQAPNMVTHTARTGSAGLLLQALPVLQAQGQDPTFPVDVPVDEGLYRHSTETVARPFAEGVLHLCCHQLSMAARLREVTLFNDDDDTIDDKTTEVDIDLRSILRAFVQASLASPQRNVWAGVFGRLSATSQALLHTLSTERQSASPMH
ncbi:hypothetical protein KIPB_004658 [Kipferlia bialata]|uniref:Armadillo-type fold n=1 Tax=Kipferlia bialata TaxID=797122 RepID=A0A9K3GGQ7_9EUKA|nr:hypothetical protein KIPB_004658 [Kipferlia bialata]|eukprot:g4658.t1